MDDAPQKFVGYCNTRARCTRVLANRMLPLGCLSERDVGPGLLANTPSLNAGMHERMGWAHCQGVANFA